MKASQAFPSKYLKCADLQDRTIKVVMSNVDIETLGQGEDTEKKPVLYFQGKDRGLVLNITNANTISDAYGDEMDDWKGFEIELYPTTTEFKGRMVDTIRVRIPKKKPAQNGDRITSGRQAPRDDDRDTDDRPVEKVGTGRPASRNADLDDDIPFAPEMRG